MRSLRSQGRTWEEKQLRGQVVLPVLHWWHSECATGVCWGLYKCLDGYSRYPYTFEYTRKNSSKWKIFGASLSRDFPCPFTHHNFANRLRDKINEAFYCNRILRGSPEMPSGELVGTTLKLTTGREVTDGHSHFPTMMWCVMKDLTFFGSWNLVRNSNFFTRIRILRNDRVLIDPWCNLWKVQWKSQSLIEFEFLYWWFRWSRKFNLIKFFLSRLNTITYLPICPKT